MTGLCILVSLSCLALIYLIMNSCPGVLGMWTILICVVVLLDALDGNMDLHLWLVPDSWQG